MSEISEAPFGIGLEVGPDDVDVSMDAVLAMLADDAYMLLHSDDSIFFGGELRGQLRLVQVPEPSMALLIGLGLSLLAARARPTSRRGC